MAQKSHDGPGGASVTRVSGAATAWVTQSNNNDFDYYDAFAAPVLTFDLGVDKAIDGFSFWNYFNNHNAAKDISPRFATAAEGTGAFGTSILANPAFVLALDVMIGDPQERQDIGFSAVTARFVEVTVTDNHFVLGSGLGGDRVGMGELQFNAVPEPGTLALFGLGLAGLGFARRRRAV